MGSTLLRTWLLAALVSGAPSTVWSPASGRSVLESTRAAGTLLGRPSLVRGGLAHGVISMWWTWAFRRARVDSAGRGAAAGLAVAAFDLGVVGRRVAAVRALPVGPQVADHLAFGVVVGLLGPR
jgi:hypothetical protein